MVTCCKKYLKELVDFKSPVGCEAVEQNVGSPGTTQESQLRLISDQRAELGNTSLLDLRPAFGWTLLRGEPGLGGGATSVLWLDHSLRKRRLQAAVTDKHQGHCRQSRVSSG